MAAYREHITVSGVLGLGYGVGAVLGFGFTPAQGILAGWLTAMGGITPDLDSDTGRPVREMFGLMAAVLPLILISHVQTWTGLHGDLETTMVLVLGMYLGIKYGLAALISSVSVHRGMFHSIPAMAIAAEIIYLSYPNDNPRARLLMAGGVALGFFSHLLLDEVYSVQWSGVRLKLKKSAGSALKFFGDAPIPNMITYLLLIGLSYLMLTHAGIIAAPPRLPGVPLQAQQVPAAVRDMPTELGDAAPFVLDATSLPADRLPPRTAAGDAPARSSSLPDDAGILR
jgi:membrane-bound metal-dependent hydrolase YbcI (DUF457 family)